MPIFRKGHRAVHFAHVPRTGGRSIMHAVTSNGWTIERYVDGDKSDIRSHTYYEEEFERASLIPSFGVVRDPVDRFISATRFEGRCQNQSDVKTLVSLQEGYPLTEERHFDPQLNFIGPHTIIYKYETEYEQCIKALKVAGLIHTDHKMARINDGSVLFDVDKSELGPECMKIRKWYLDDYRKFGYMPSKS